MDNDAKLQLAATLSRLLPCENVTRAHARMSVCGAIRRAIGNLTTPSDPASAQVDTLRIKLLKVAAVVTRNTRRIRLYLASHWPWPHRVGVGQRVARHGRAKSQVIQPLALRGQTRLDVSQRLAKGQLRERHRVELIQAQEALDLVLAAVARHAAPKRRQRQVRHDLREYELALMHRHPERGSPAMGSKSAARR